MENQHPIPQQISSYQFRLVGDMTLKQFFQIAGGALISLLIYATPLHPVIKWPLILFFSLTGVALAFLPFEDRPLDRWVISFFKSVYSPTVYLWAKNYSKTEFFREDASAPPEEIVAPQGKEELEKYLKTRTDQKHGFLSKLEAAEQNFLSRVSGLFGQGKAAAPAPQPQQQQQQPTQEVAEAKQQRASDEDSDIKIPETPQIRVEKKETGAQKEVSEDKIPEEAEQLIQKLAPEAPQQQKQKKEAQQAQFSVDAAPPSPPSRPNTVSGQVMDPDGKIVEGAILEIKDVAGRPVRAVKTNKLGHFLIVTPLDDGTYEIETEKEGLTFDTVKFEAEGTIVPPIAVKAKGREKSEEKNEEQG